MDISFIVIRSYKSGDVYFMESLSQTENGARIGIIARRECLGSIINAAIEVGGVSVRSAYVDEVDGAKKIASEIVELHDGCISGTRSDTELEARKRDLATFLLSKREEVIGLVITTQSGDLSDFWNRLGQRNEQSVFYGAQPE